MEEYINTKYYKSSKTLDAMAIRRFSALFENDRGIENFRVSTEGIYIEFNTYLYSMNLIEEHLSNHGFIIMKDRQPGFIERKIQLLAKSNLKYYGNRKPDCC